MRSCPFIYQTPHQINPTDESYQFNANEVTVEKSQIRYNLKYDQSTGVILSVSKIN